MPTQPSRSSCYGHIADGALLLGPLQLVAKPFLCYGKLCAHITATSAGTTCIILLYGDLPPLLGAPCTGRIHEPNQGGPCQIPAPAHG